MHPRAGCWFKKRANLLLSSALKESNPSLRNIAERFVAQKDAGPFYSAFAHKRPCLATDAYSHLLQLCNRQGQAKRHACEAILPGLDLSAMRHENLASKTKAYAGTAGLGRVKGNEDVLDFVAPNTLSVIFDQNGHLIVVQSAGDIDAWVAAVGDGFDRIAKDIDQGLFQQLRVGHDDQVLGRDGARIGDVMTIERRCQKALHGAENITEPDLAQNGVRQFGDGPITLDKAHQADAALGNKIYGIEDICPGILRNS